MIITDQIKHYANLFNGIKEIGENEGWEHRFYPEFGMTFQELMETIAGWQMNHAWCVYLTKLIWKLSYDKVGDSTMLKRLDELFSPNAVQTWENFKNSEFKCDRILSTGDILIWQLYKNGKPTTSGHSSNVIFGSDIVAETIDGNTSSKSHRDGDQIANKTWLINFTPKENGLVPLGFIHPIEVL